MRRYVRAAMLSAAVASLTACASSASTADHARGTIVGQVLSAPSCPVVRAGSPCPPTPATHVTVTATSTEGSHLERASTDASGRFTMSVPAGTYRVAAQSSLGTAGRGQTVTVAAGSTATVQLMVDSGIR